MSNLKAKLKRESGFTLIEMLIVVAIIAILIAIGIPMVNKALEKAREATDAANERAAVGAAMVEILSTGKLGDNNKAYYKITDKVASGATNELSGVGELVLDTGSNTPTAGADGYSYGRGTAAGDVVKDHSGGFITITYVPTGTTTETQYIVTWTVKTS